MNAELNKTNPKFGSETMRECSCRPTTRAENLSHSPGAVNTIVLVAVFSLHS